jgi:DNA-binding MarR family transcriptional regulator
MELRDDILPSEGTPKDLTAAFLQAVGIIPERTGGIKPQQLPSFRVFYHGFLLHGERWQDLRALTKVAGSTRPTLQKHLRRLEGLDLVERAAFPDDYGFPRRHWRLRQGSLAHAFEFTDARARLSLDSMGRWAAHLDELAATDRGRAARPRARKGR